MLRVQVIFLQAQVEFINAGEELNLVAHLLWESTEFSMAQSRGSVVGFRWLGLGVKVRVRVGG
jgi:hypothetical protein